MINDETMMEAWPYINHEQRLLESVADKTIHSEYTQACISVVKTNTESNVTEGYNDVTIRIHRGAVGGDFQVICLKEDQVLAMIGLLTQALGPPNDNQ